MKIKTLEQIKVAEEKNVLFVRPKYELWSKLLADNIRAMGIWAEKEKIRHELIETACRYTENITGKPCKQHGDLKIIATGHQAIWHHSGIFAKNIIASDFAKKNSCQCVHLVVDHDIDDTDMVLPGLDQAGRSCFEKISIEGNKNIPLELRKKPDEVMIENLVKNIKKRCPDSYCVKCWGEKLREQQQKAAWGYSSADVITSLQGILNEGLGLDMLYLPCSLLCGTDGFASFAASIIDDHNRFADIYNRAVLEYKRTDNFKLLQIEKNGKTELPFWVVTSSGLRRSLYVIRRNSKIELSTLCKSIGTIKIGTKKDIARELKDVLEKDYLLLRPKAVTMMLFVRGVLADVFVHGIGGGLYSKITNAIFENYFGIKNSGIAITTATNNLISSDGVETDINIKELKRDMRKMQNNPEKYLSKKQLKDEIVAELVKRKHELIQKASGVGNCKSAKRKAWEDIKVINDKLTRYISESINQVAGEIEDAAKAKKEEEVLNYRGYFYGLFSENRLRDIIKLQ